MVIDRASVTQPLLAEFQPSAVLDLASFLGTYQNSDRSNVQHAGRFLQTISQPKLPATDAFLRIVSLGSASPLVHAVSPIDQAPREGDAIIAINGVEITSLQSFVAESRKSATIQLQLVHLPEIPVMDKYQTLVHDSIVARAVRVATLTASGIQAMGGSTLRVDAEHGGQKLLLDKVTC